MLLGSYCFILIVKVKESVIIQTKDNIINFTVSPRVCDTVFSNADFSIVNMPEAADEAETLAKRLYGLPNSNHVTMLLFRQKDELAALTNLIFFDGNSDAAAADWGYLGSQALTYERTSKAVGEKRMVKLSEPSTIFFKGTHPSVKETGKFAPPGYSNCTNLIETFILHNTNEALLYKNTTYLHNFSWYVGVIMKALCPTVESRSFIYAAPIKDNCEMKSIYLFCKFLNYNAQIVVPTIEDAKAFKKACDSINLDENGVYING